MEKSLYSEFIERIPEYKRSLFPIETENDRLFLGLG